MEKNMTFESAMNRLNEISSAMEKSDISLDESLKLYTEAVELAAFCRKYLEEAKLKVVTPLSE